MLVILHLISFSYILVGATLHNNSTQHYTAAYLKGDAWMFYDGKLKPPHTHPLTADVLMGSLVEHVLYIKEQ